MAMFSATVTIKKAVKLINELESSKFPLLLTRLLQKLHVKDERAFSEEEEERLQKAFSLDSQELNLVVETCEFFLHQAAYHTAKPNVLSQQLLQLEVSEDKVSAIVEAWKSNAREIVDKLRRQALAPKQLEDVNWRLHLQMGQSSKAKLKQPTAMLELGVRDQQTGEKDKVRMEFTHEELYAFYNKLETIQGQIDALS